MTHNVQQWKPNYTILERGKKCVVSIDLIWSFFYIYLLYINGIKLCYYYIFILRCTHALFASYSCKPL